MGTTATVVPTADSLSEYVTVDGRTYKDTDVRHRYTCDGKGMDIPGRLGIDLPLAASKRYTITLAGTAATLAEDP